ncbi:4Fe-4S ferredoxin N-terminal domain-containing protein [Halorubrum sp. DTA98]|uniref:4Fe-4S ferredoxin N-terminal domain-containing protein n=1 Tax=Halorubrum sp. DTA98 TaxID=3402163 RepID=UPI003AAB34DA
MSRNNELDPLETLESLDTEPEPSEYDQDLGREVGEAAMRVANGELSEERFHELFHERFKSEFGDEYVAPEGIDDE